MTGLIELPIIQLGLELGIINIQTQEIEILNDIHFSCGITGVCCSTLKIPINEWDIDQILDNGFELDQIVTELSPIIPSRTLNGKTEKVYLIKRKPFDSTCTFLKEDNLCKIHSFKPFTCRIYPFILEKIDDHIIKVRVHTDKLCNTIKSANKKNSNTLHNLQFILNTIQKDNSRY